METNDVLMVVLGIIVGSGILNVNNIKERIKNKREDKKKAEYDREYQRIVENSSKYWEDV